MSINDKASFQNAFKQHYTNLKPVLYIWDKNSEYHEYEDKTTYKKEFTIDSKEPYTFEISNQSNWICNHNHDQNDSRSQCKPDVVKCPIEHMMILHNTENTNTHTVFDFQPMSARTTENDDHGKNILKYRAEYGVFDADFLGDKQFKQNKMKKVVIYHPRYHLKEILDELENVQDYQYPFDPKKDYNGRDMNDNDKRYNKDDTIKNMGRRYIFLSVDYLSNNPTFDVSKYITEREKEMMIHLFGVPGSDTMADTSKWGDPAICSMEEKAGKKYWKMTLDRESGTDTVFEGSLFRCRNEKEYEYSEDICEDKNRLTGPMDRCRRCENGCNGNFVARPCARNVWYSKYADENEYRPENAVEKNGKVCMFDGYGTEIPDDVNDSDDVCWKAGYLLTHWDTKCKDYTHFKKNYCAGAPENDLKMSKPEDYKNARYLTANVCNPTPTDMNGLCEWVANVEYLGNISGYPVELYCGCHKRTFLNQNKYGTFLKLAGNQAKLNTVKEWSQNSVLNDVFYDENTQTYGLQSTDKGIVEQIEPMCWPSCTTLKNAPVNANRTFLTTRQNDSCAINACINMIEANDNTNLNLDNIKQSCTYTSRYDETEEPSGNIMPIITNNANGGNNNGGNNNDDEKDKTEKDEEEDTYWGLTLKELIILIVIVLLCCMMFASGMIAILSV